MKTAIQNVVGVLCLAAPAYAQQAVQWRVEDGGNGHWYQLQTVPSQWIYARQVALSKGGDLCSLETNTERGWIEATMPCVLAYVGGYQLPGATTPSDRWIWLTGAPVSLPLDCDDNPCVAGTASEDGEQDYLHSAACWAVYGDVNIVAYGDCAVPDWGLALVEWSADCNGDGVVDYGQIRQGQLADLNTDGVPDVCQPPTCRNADIYRDFNVNGADLGILLSQWGPNTPLTESDLNNDGVVNGADLGLLLSFWGACPN
jgi:hypothetical protein